MHKGFDSTLDSQTPIITGHPDPAYAISAGQQEKGGVFGSGRDSQPKSIGFNWQNGGGYGNANDGLGITEEGTGPLSRSQVPACVTGQRTHALTTRAAAVEEDGTGRGTPIIRIDSTASTAMPSLAFSHSADGNSHGIACVIEGSPPLRGGGGGNSMPAVCRPSAMQVRRLTPTECCRLQGFPDDHCDIAFRKKPAADGPKYRALGNSMAVPCMAWLGYRIQLATGRNNKEAV
jgi:hypothetical protein